MPKKDPPFRITNRMMEQTAEIGELLGKLVSTETLSSSPTLRRTNRIRSIHASLAIEQNSLSLEQVTAVLGGKHVLAPPKDIREVQNACEIYEQVDQLDPFSVEDLLMAHEIMTRGLVKESGSFRSGAVGVVDGEGNILHFGTLPAYVPQLVEELLEWTKQSDLPVLIKSCIFHYEFELIHPFADGNGRMGRLWQTMLLCRWEQVFAWLPIESMIHHRQKEYYDVINRSNAEGESTLFVEFMLDAIRSTLEEAVLTTGRDKRNKENRWNTLQAYLKDHETIRNSDVRDLLNISPATANRILSGLCAEGKLVKIRIGRSWGYRKADEIAT